MTQNLLVQTYANIISEKYLFYCRNEIVPKKPRPTRSFLKKKKKDM